MNRLLERAVGQSSKVVICKIKKTLCMSMKFLLGILCDNVLNSLSLVPRLHPLSTLRKLISILSDSILNSRYNGISQTVLISDVASFQEVVYR